jgi:proteasome lid subunit RPN8/RPN11
MTWKPTKKILEEALAHAERDKPMESCGVVVSGKYVPIANRATVVDHFSMDRREYLAACKSGKLQAVVHSHVYSPPIASQGDRAMCEITAVPWLILNWPVGTHAVIEPSGYVAPLIGRHWAFGSLDCWGLFCDAFKAFTGKEIPYIAREWQFWTRGQSLIIDSLDEAGFVNLGHDVEPRHCDMIIMQIRSEVPNHVGIYLEPDGIMLHQLEGLNSVRETYGGFFQKATRAIARHKDFLEAMPPIRDPKDRSIWTGEVAGQEPT